jgi:heptosyltransferase-2
MISPQKILLIRPDRLGDLILSLPVAESLKKNIPGCEVNYIASPYAGGIAPMVGYVDGWIPDGDYNGRRLSTTQLARKIRAGGYDCLIELKPSWRTAAAGFLSGVKLRIGTSRRLYSLFYSERVRVHRKASGFHQIDLELMHLKPLNIMDYIVEPHLQVTENGLARADRVLQG